MRTGTLEYYVWLLNVIRSSEGITLREIEERSIRSDRGPLPRKTFDNHRKKIEELFDVNICCKRRGKDSTYYIESTKLLDSDITRSWILSTLSASMTVHSASGLRSRILLENIPSGEHYLATILEAMQENKVLHVVYKSFFKSEKDSFTLSPYALKIFRQRWYVLGTSSHRDDLRTFALDRVQELSIGEESFVLPKSFSAEKYFADFFGIVADKEQEIEEICLRVYGKQIAYLKSLPLHRSQRILRQGKDYTDLSLKLCPTYDFLQELLHHGPLVEVLSPDWLRDELRQILNLTLDRYK